MLAYCTALGVPKAWLVYAGPGGRRRRRIRNTGISVEEFRLDISQTPEALLARVQELADTAFLHSVERQAAVRENTVGGVH